MYLSDCVHGDHLNLAKIQKLVEDNSDMQDLSKAQQQEFINKLQLYHNINHTGAGASNTAAALNCQRAIARISNKVHIP
jgi:hypothetical protein